MKKEIGLIALCLLAQCSNLEKVGIDLNKDTNAREQANLSTAASVLGLVRTSYAPSDTSASVSFISNITIANNTDTYVSWAVKNYDTSGFFNASNPTVLRIPVTGKYMITTQVSWNANATSFRLIQLIGVYNFTGTTVNGVSGGITSVGTSTIETLTAGTQILVNVKQNSGAPLDMLFGTVAIAKVD